jgi:hypothetical protein
MNPEEPLFMRFVGRLGREAMDQKIFRRATVSEAVTEVDLDATNAADPLDSAQFGFAVPKRLKSLVALPSKFLERGVGLLSVFALDRTRPTG